MSDNGAKAPTEASTSPMGNTAMKPTPLARGISEHVAEKLRRDHPDQHRRMREYQRLKETHSGHAR